MRRARPGWPKLTLFGLVLYYNSINTIILCTLVSLVQQREVLRGGEQALRGRQREPLARLRVVPPHTQAEAVAEAQVVLRVRVGLLRRRLRVFFFAGSVLGSWGKATRDAVRNTES